MTTLTDSDMVRRVLAHLHVAEGGEPIPAEEYATVLEKLGDVVAEGRTRGLIYWGSDGTPQECASAMEQIVAARVCRRFDAPEYEPDELAGWRRLSQLVSEPYRARPIRASHI